MPSSVPWPLRVAALLLLAASALLPAASVGARTLEVGPGRPYALPSEAAAAAQDGDRVAIAAGDYLDCAVWWQSDLVIEGDPGAVIGGRVCQDKAVFVITGANVAVRNFTLARAKSTAANGAGIRAEGRGLVVEGVRFMDNENGILTSADQQSTLTVRDSEFLRNGSCEQACAHGIYAGRIAELRVERSRFLGTRQGHHVKSRALRTEVVDSEIADGPDGTASYLIDVPNGGDVLIRGNRLQKGQRSENRSTAISVGAEGVDRPTPEIRVEGNTFEAAGDYATAFVVNFSATTATLSGNRLSGRVVPQRGPGSAKAE